MRLDIKPHAMKTNPPSRRDHVQKEPPHLNHLNTTEKQDVLNPFDFNPDSKSSLWQNESSK